MVMEMDYVHFRPATEKDVPALLWLIQLYTEDRNEPDALKIGEETLLRDGFGEKCCFRVILAELVGGRSPSEDPGPVADPPPLSASMQKDERLIGYALYYFTYSTWQGRVLFLEDLFIRAPYRNKGYGRALTRECSKVAVEKDCCRMALQVLGWNTKALRLFERVGGECLREWWSVYLYKPNLHKLANQDMKEACTAEKVHFRPATKKDIPAILWLIQVLAEYEKEPHALKIGKEELLRDGFGEDCYFKVILAELDVDSTPIQEPISDTSLPSASMQKNERLIGYVLYYFNYSTWQGRSFYMEDLFIREPYRNRGYGTGLIRACAKIAKENDCCRMMWIVIYWNKKALDLYERVGGEYVQEWLLVHMYKSNLHTFATGDSPQN